MASMALSNRAKAALSLRELVPVLHLEAWERNPGSCSAASSSCESSWVACCNTPRTCRDPSSTAVLLTRGEQLALSSRGGLQSKSSELLPNPALFEGGRRCPGASFPLACFLEGAMSEGWAHSRTPRYLDLMDGKQPRSTSRHNDRQYGRQKDPSRRGGLEAERRMKDLHHCPWRLDHSALNFHQYMNSLPASPQTSFHSLGSPLPTPLPLRLEEQLQGLQGYQQPCPAWAISPISTRNGCWGGHSSNESKRCKVFNNCMLAVEICDSTCIEKASCK